MRRRIVCTVLALMALAGPTHADSFADYVVRQLQAQGFTEFETSTTLLGRTRIVASGADGTREIVLNPATGEILRDLWLIRDDDANSGRSGGSSGRNGDDDDDDDNDDNDNDDDDDSGGGDDDGGSDNSGSGGSGSDDGDDD